MKINNRLNINKKKILRNQKIKYNLVDLIITYKLKICKNKKLINYINFHNKILIKKNF